MNDALTALGAGANPATAKTMATKDDNVFVTRGDEGVGGFQTALAARMETPQGAHHVADASVSAQEKTIAEPHAQPRNPAENGASCHAEHDEDVPRDDSPSAASVESADTLAQAALLAQVGSTAALSSAQAGAQSAANARVSVPQDETAAQETVTSGVPTLSAQNMSAFAVTADRAASGQMLPMDSRKNDASSSTKISVAASVGEQAKSVPVQAESGKPDFLSRFVSGLENQVAQSGVSVAQRAESTDWVALPVQVHEFADEPGDLLRTLAQGDVPTNPPPIATALAAEVSGRMSPQSGSLQLAVEAPVRSPVFAQELGDRLVWLSSGRQGQHVADISLNPANLGPVEVKLSVSGGQANAQFFSPHPQVREAIEAAMPKLREMLAQAGVALGQADVQDQSLSRDQTLAHPFAHRNDEGRTYTADEPEVMMRMPARQVGLGRVDLYA